MNEQNTNNPADQPFRKTSFLTFWQFIAKNLGDSRLRIRADANSVDTLLALNSDHREFLRDVIITSYFESDCCSINDPINLNTILDVMGEAAYELQGRNQDDLMDIELLEEIAFLIQQRYYHCIDIPKSGLTNRPETVSAAVVNLSERKIQKANAKL